ncbi:MAG: SpoIID/LytB domain-containing protein [Firmicutes bacterium]|nr:SpoIID/LytB domain-containing protein [Bacillota bacterium]
MKKLMYLCAIAVFILVTSGFASMVYASTIRVGLVRAFYNQNSITISTTSIDVGRGRANGSFEVVRTLNSPAGFTVRMSNGQVVVQAGGETVFTFVNDSDGGRQIRATGGGIISMGSDNFRGVIEFRPSGGQVSAINVICIEEYIYGVLSMEMSPHFHIEALRAQAVAARTFAMYTKNRGTYSSRGFDICDRSSCCQAYRGTYREYEIMRQAVRDTRGLMVFKPGSNEPVLTPYFSSSGGSTDCVENVWGGVYAHLTGVWDFYEQNPRIWSRTYTWAQLTAAVRAHAPGANIGTVTGVSITEERLGRVQELTFIGTNGQWTATREQVSDIFRHISRRLYSRNFTISGAVEGGGSTIYITCGDITQQAPVSNLYVVDSFGNVVPANNTHVFDGVALGQPTQTTVTDADGTGITINGRGWGHGVGMSQQGANSMAQAGYDFRSILLHYYSGVEIR